MMIARFRIVGWVAACAFAALLCYLAAQRVASERLALAKVEREIVQLTAENARLETEIATRSRTGQLERWNSAMFRLGAPAPTQYFESGVRPAAFVEGRLPLDPNVVASKGAVTQVAYRPEPATSAPAIAAPAAPAKPIPAPTRSPIQTVAATVSAPQPSLLHQATFVRPKPDRLATPEPPLVKVALATIPKARLAGILEDAPRAKAKAKPALTLAPLDLGTLAAAEGKASKRGKRADGDR